MLKTPYEKIIDESKIGEVENHVTINELYKMAESENLPPSEIKDNYKKKALVIIDYQNDFVSPKGALPVNGAVDDVKRLTKYIYDHIGEISAIYMTYDSHHYAMIFHPMAWGDAKGTHVGPFTVITKEKVDKGEIVPLMNPPKQLEYLDELEKTGKVLTIWPYHCIMGTTGWNIENQTMNMVCFYEAVRRKWINKLVKGLYPFSEMYGAIKPEVQNGDGNMNIAWLKNFNSFDEIEITGEARDFCLYESVKQICEFFENDPITLKKISVLLNASSCIGSESETNAKYDALVQKYGISLKNI